MYSVRRCVSDKRKPLGRIVKRLRDKVRQTSKQDCEHSKHGNHAHGSLCRRPGRLRTSRLAGRGCTVDRDSRTTRSSRQATGQEISWLPRRQSVGGVSPAIAGRLCRTGAWGRKLVLQSDVIPVVRPVRMHHVRIAEDALWLGATGSDAKTLLGWDMLRLIAVTKTTKTEMFRHWETKGSRAEVKLKVTAYTEDYAEYLADVFAVQPDRQVLGVEALLAGVELFRSLGNTAPDALVDANARMEGFRLLVLSIASRASQVYVPPESAALLTKSAKERAQTPASASLDDFNAVNRWLLQRLHLQGSGHGGVGLP